MSELSKSIGSKIRNVRKYKGITLEQLASKIHKSKATISKYETGEITLDVDTLYEIAQALELEVDQLLDKPLVKKNSSGGFDQRMKSPFYMADTLYFYFYDGRYKRLKEGVIHIHRNHERNEYEASLYIRAQTPTGRSNEIFYKGKVVYSDMLIRFSFVNQYNNLEEDLLYIFNPFDLRDFTEGLLCGISSSDLMPCAFKCLVALKEQEATEVLKEHLLFTTKDLRKWKKMNMMMVDNRLQDTFF